MRMCPKSVDATHTNGENVDGHLTQQPKANLKKGNTLLLLVNMELARLLLDQHPTSRPHMTKWSHLQRQQNCLKTLPYQYRLQGYLLLEIHNCNIDTDVKG